jgi:hypothetical protein
MVAKVPSPAVLLSSAVAASLLLAASTLADAQPRPPKLCVDVPGGCAPEVDSAAYPHYPALNLNAIPWHTAAGPWGPRVRIEAPALPSISRSVTVNSRAEFNAAASVAGTRITIATGWAGNSTATINASDIEVIIPAGVAVGAIEIGAWPRSSAISRVRIRGPVAGTHSGGRMGQYRDFELASDIIIDGIDVNGDSGFGGGETNQAFRASGTRLAILNSRVISAGYNWLGSAKQVVIANSNFYHGAAARSAVGFVEGWGIRNTGGPLTIVDSRIQGTRYHNLRTQSVGGSGELLYVNRTTFVAVAEGRTAWMWNNLGTGNRGQGAIIENSAVYSYTAPGCGLGQEISAADVGYSRLRNNRFFGAGNAVYSQAYLDAQAASGGGSPGDHDWSVGNSFSVLTSLPAWAGPGDPRQVPLPAGLTLISGEGACPSFQ